MKTLTIVGLTIAVLVGLGVFYILSRTPSTGDAPTDTGLFPTGGYQNDVSVGSGGTDEPGQGGTSGSDTGGGSIQPITENYFEVQSQSGGLIRVKDFRKSATTVEDDVNKGTYYLAGNDFATAAYTLMYIEGDSSFTITIFSEPIGEMRRKAEIDLLAKLGIAEPVACSLRYAVLVPASANEIYAGRNLGFSFCQGATPL
ncbi:MAG: hypothetical protein KBD50_01285 [Candidatus Pacebacteria bacterium]|nr:hypothetical protein [Candidatus Paceibacterota bacterium]